jgi:hypothetical protein
MDYCNKLTLTPQLSRFLGTFWLSDDHINMLVEEIFHNIHTERPEILKYVQVALLSFAQELRSVKKKLALPLPDHRKTLLYKYELRIKEDGLQKLYFPIHVSENHWIVGMVNFKKKSIAFGENQYYSFNFDDCTDLFLADSLYGMMKGSGAPTKFITALQTWLKASFGKRFKSFRNSLDHAVQDDGYSCGIITANTMAHAILNRPLCNSNHATEERLKWFIRFASLYPAKSASATLDKDINLAAPEDLSNTQARKALTIAALLNPIDNGPSEHLTTTSYDSDGSSDSEDILDVPVRPKGKPPMSTSESPSDGHKCTRPDSLTSSNTESSDGYESSANSLATVEDKQKAKYVKAGEGTSRSATASRVRREKLRDGTLSIEAWRIEAWKKKVLRDDPKVEFNPKHIRRVRHLGCGKYVKMKDPCDIGRWRDHIEACNKKRSKKPAGGTPTLFQLGWAKVTGEKKKKISNNNSGNDDSESGSEPELTMVPCPGITVSDDPQVLQYLKRTGASGGSGRSLQNSYSRNRSASCRRKPIGRL